MIYYNPKDCFAFFFNVPKFDAIRKLWPFMLSVSAFSGLITSLTLSLSGRSKSNYAISVRVMPSLLGIVIAMLLVHETNAFPIVSVFNLAYAVVFIFSSNLYVLTSLERTAEEIKRSSKSDTIDISVDDFCSNIEKHVEQILSK